MKEVELSRKSWHYQVATRFGNYNERFDGNDICSYRSSVLVGLMAFMGFLLAMLVVIWVVIVPVIGIYDYFNNIVIPDRMIPALIMGGIIDIGLVGIGIALLREHYVDRLHNNRIDYVIDNVIKEPSYLSLWYRDFRDKICRKVIFKD